MAKSKGNLRHGYALNKFRHSNCKERKLYDVWSAMKRRCNCNHGPVFKSYKLRGISVCERWMDVKNFFEDMAATWSDGLTLERINNDLGYCPENCRWSTRQEQMRNTRRIKLITREGCTMNISEWSKKIGVSNSMIGWHVKKGKSHLEALEFLMKRHYA